MRLERGEKMKECNLNVNKLKAKMIEKGYNVESLAVALGMDKSTLYRKLQRLEAFTIGEVRKIKEILELTDSEAVEIFL